MLAKHRIIKRGIRTRGVYGLYAKYFGQRRGRPTEADRIALQVILDMPPERRVEFEWKEADEGSASAS